jgi:primosomal protein N' (replication factor Y) (superfamily II helicase)
MLFADVILPLPLPQLFTYGVPDDLAEMAECGKRVIIQFGAKKIYTALIRKLHNNQPSGYKVKDIISVLDETPVVNEMQFKFWEWIASYYLCNIGEVYKAALPSGLKLESETKILYNPDFTEYESLTEKEKLFIEVIEKHEAITIDKLVSLSGIKNPIKLIKTLLDKKAIFAEEKLRESYKPRQEAYLRLSEKIHNEEQLHLTLDLLKKAPKQQQILTRFIELSGCFAQDIAREVNKNELPPDSNQAVNSLISKNILEVYSKEISRLNSKHCEVTGVKTLNDYQLKAFEEIKQHFLTKDVVLLHGVTSSGKTEVYIHLIEEELRKGRQVLYLVPEIALTTQIIVRLKNVFGNLTGIYHSRFSDAERVEIWKNIASPNEEGSCKLVLGVRSSVFLPFSKLGLIIVDEEHENTFKQFDPAPRYNARDSALVLAKLHGAKVLMGSATPSIESYYNCSTEKYALVKITQRYKDIQMPATVVANTREAYRKKQMKSHFTPLLLNNITEALKNKEQIILFQNRRGFSPYIQCEDCGCIPHCSHCDVSLTYHKRLNQLVCHYCGFVTTEVSQCPDCGSTKIKTMGFGTEKIEEEISLLYPEVTVARLDIDSSRSKKAFEQIITGFELHNIDILIGTQMISKGLDFDNVGIVGIMNADNMLNFPDFRAFERSYQLIVQVSGRAGRKNKQGKVIIQTSDDKHPIIGYIVNNDFQTLYYTQLEERKLFRYPPYYRLIHILLRHKTKEKLDTASYLLAENLRKIFGNRVLGPEYPVVEKIQDYYQKNIILKIEKESSAIRAKSLIQQSVGHFMELPGFKNIQVIFDVDPM